MSGERREKRTQKECDGQPRKDVVIWSHIWERVAVRKLFVINLVTFSGICRMSRTVQLKFKIKKSYESKEWGLKPFRFMMCNMKEEINVNNPKKCK